MRKQSWFSFIQPWEFEVCLIQFDRCWQMENVLAQYALHIQSRGEDNEKLQDMGFSTYPSDQVAPEIGTAGALGEWTMRHRPHLVIKIAGQVDLLGKYHHLPPQFIIATESTVHQ